MMMTFWNKLYSQWTHLHKERPMTPEQLHIERLLLPRLKMMGYLFFFFSLAAITFMIVMTRSENFFVEVAKEEAPNPAVSLEQLLPPAFFASEAPDEIELDPMEVLNFYLIGAIFAALGFSCLFFSQKKKRELTHIHFPHHPHEHKD